MTRPYWPHSNPEPRDSSHTLGGIPAGRTHKADEALQPVHVAVPPAPCLNGCKRNSLDGPEPTLVEAPARICQPCRKALDRWLNLIPDIYALLLYVREHGTVTGNPESSHTKQPDPPAPMRLEVTDLLDVRPGRGVFGLMHSWAQQVRDERHLRPDCACGHESGIHWWAPPLRGHCRVVTSTADWEIPCRCEEYKARQPTVAAECALLGSNLPWITQQPWVGDLCSEVKPLVRRMQDAVGDYRPVPLGMCVNEVSRPGVQGSVLCGGTLYRDQTGDALTVCVACGDRNEYSTMRRLGLKIGVISDNGDVSSREAS